MKDGARFGVRSLAVGRCQVPGPEVFWMSDFDMWYPLTFQVALIEGDGVTALVNTGPPADLGPINERWQAALGERGRLVREEHETISDNLARVGLEPGQVTHVILTPLQLYTTGNVLLFRNAEILISRRGWIQLHTAKQHPHDNRQMQMPSELLVQLVTDAWDRVRLLEDEDQVVDGISAWWAGTHHRATMAIDVDSTRGRVVISDAFFTYRNVETGPILGINESMEEAMVAYRRARLADHLFPLYDPEVFERHPGGVIAPRPS